MGSVYRARQLEIDKAVAIKILRRELTAEPSAVARFKREAKTASRLDHPSSVRVLDYGEQEDGTCFLVMELLEGRTLYQIVRDEGPLSKRRIVDILRQVLAALAVAHDLGIIHRDLKPENIIVHKTVDDEGHTTEIVKVCDFGVAKMNPSRQEAAEQGQEMLTSHGVVVGTPEYMSPEQGRGQKLDGRSDLYAVGVILYQLLTGRVPFMADTPVNVLLKHVMERPIPPSRINPDADPALERICMKAMSKPPAHRHESARAMRQELKAALGDGSASPIVESESSPRVTFRTESYAEGEAESDTIELSSESIRKVPMTQPSLRSQLMSVPPSARRQSRAKVIVSVVLAAAAATVGVAFLREAPVTPPEVKPAAASSSSVGTASASPPLLPASPSASASTSASASASASPAESASASAAPADVAPPSASAATSEPAAIGTGEANTSASASASPNASPSVDAPAGAAAASAGGQVLAGSVRCDRAPAADVLAALPMGRFTQCYREGSNARPGLAGGATLHLKMESDGWISEASFAGSESLAEIGKCVARAAAGRKVANAQPGTSSAEVDLVFKPD